VAPRGVGVPWELGLGLGVAVGGATLAVASKEALLLRLADGVLLAVGAPEEEREG
jgi:hypothetical protein